VLTSIITQIPHTAKIFVVSRKEPPAILARLKVTDKLHMIRWPHLRLNKSEVKGIVLQSLGKQLTDQEFAELHAKTDGWAAGLLLLIRRGQLDGIEPQQLSRHTPQEIFDYFGSELFNRLPDSVQKKMLQLAFLNRFSVDAAKRVIPEGDVEAFLLQLHQNNAFLARMAGEQLIYSFHTLMQSFLQARVRNAFSPSMLKDLLLKSATILVEEDNIEAAVRCYTEAEAVITAVDLIVSLAPTFASQARFQTIETLIDLLPTSVTDSLPWLLYWRGACRLPYAVKQGGDLPPGDELRHLFIQALSRFEQAEDQVGCYLALAGILESIWMELNDFSQLDPWIAKYDQLCRKWGLEHPPEVMPWLIPAYLSALVTRQPTHPTIQIWQKRGTECLKLYPGATVAIRILVPMTFLSILQGELAKTEHLMNLFMKNTDENASPLGAVIFHTMNALYCWLKGRFLACQQSAGIAGRLKQQYGIRYLFTQAHDAVGFLSAGDIKKAESLLQEIQPKLADSGHWMISYYHMVAGWLALLKKDLMQAEYHASFSLEAAEKASCPSTLPIHYLQSALVCHLKSQREMADNYLETAIDLSRRFHSRQVEFGCLIIRAEFLAQSDDQYEFERALRDAFALGKAYSYMNTYLWRPDAMADLCQAALERDIEVAYVQSLIRYRHLTPKSPPRKLAGWPWRLKIRTFGRFTLEIDGKPILFKRKTQHRPLSMLKYILAQGGRQVPDSQLKDELWPDADGDRAAFSFKSTLHRLRELLGKRMIQFRTGFVTLDDRQCWTDLWALEDCYNEIQNVSKNATTEQQVPRLLDLILQIYQGPFLPDETADWAKETRQGCEDYFTAIVIYCVNILIKSEDEKIARQSLCNALIVAPTNTSLRLLCKKIEKK
jgi:hypothetical protein